MDEYEMLYYEYDESFDDTKKNVVKCQMNRI